eukprot:CFRG4399T1
MPKICIVGAGLIGVYTGGCLMKAGLDVTLVGRQWLADKINSSGQITLTDYASDKKVIIPASDVNIHTTLASAVAEDIPDVLILTIKNLANESVCKEIKALKLPSSVCVVTMQNGIVASPFFRDGLPHNTIVPGICSFNVQSVSDGVYHRGTSGPIVLGSNAPGWLIHGYANAGLEVKQLEEEAMLAYMRGKLVVNLNNSVNALSGMTLVEQVGNWYCRKITADAYSEALAVFAAANLPVTNPMSRLPLSLALIVMKLPDYVFNLLAGKTFVAIDEKATSSMQEDLVLKRNTEIMELNGHISDLGLKYGVNTPVNDVLTKLIIEAQEKREGSPNWSPEELYAKAQQAIAMST